MRNRFVLRPQFASTVAIVDKCRQLQECLRPLNSRRLFATAVVCLLAFMLAIPATAIEPKLSVPIMPLEDVKAGMHGTAYTVFEGSKPEPMQVEVLGILRNMTGPKGDVILVRLHGDKARIYRCGGRHER